jgi:hypothetical protein
MLRRAPPSTRPLTVSTDLLTPVVCDVPQRRSSRGAYQGWSNGPSIRPRTLAAIGAAVRQGARRGPAASHRRRDHPGALCGDGDQPSGSPLCPCRHRSRAGQPPDSTRRRPPPERKWPRCAPHTRLVSRPRRRAASARQPADSTNRDAHGHIPPGSRFAGAWRRRLGAGLRLTTAPGARAGQPHRRTARPSAAWHGQRCQGSSSPRASQVSLSPNTHLAGISRKPGTSRATFPYRIKLAPAAAPRPLLVTGCSCAVTRPCHPCRLPAGPP